MAYTIISQNNNTTTLSDGVNTITVPSRVNLTSGNFTIVEVNNNMATLEDGDGNVYRDIPCVATLAGEGGGGGSSLPDQTGHSGEFLTTDGTDASWAAVNALQNTATGTNALTILGTAATNKQAVNIGVSSEAGDSATAVGRYARATYSSSCAYGNSSYAGATFTTAVGNAAFISGSYGVALGAKAQVTAQNAIQIGSTGTSTSNSDANTFKVANRNGNFEIMSADGTIPEARLADTTNAQQGDVLTLDSTGNAVWQAGGGGGLQNTATGLNSLSVLGTATTQANSINIGVGSDAAMSVQQVVIGTNAYGRGTSSVGIGYNVKAQAEGDVVIGTNAEGDANNHTGKIIIGYGAKATAAHAIQFGSGNFGTTYTNSDANTFKVGNANGNFEIMDANGNLPADRLASTTGLADGNYRLRLTISSGVPTLSWVAE